RWAQVTLERVVGRVREEFLRTGRIDQFERLKVFLLGQPDVPYADLSRQMETSEGALRVSIHRLRKRYRDLLRAEIEETVADPAEVEGELRFLATALGSQ